MRYKIVLRQDEEGYIAAREDLLGGSEVREIEVAV